MIGEETGETIIRYTITVAKYTPGRVLFLPVVFRGLFVRRIATKAREEEPATNKAEREKKTGTRKRKGKWKLTERLRGHLISSLNDAKVQRTAAGRLNHGPLIKLRLAPTPPRGPAEHLAEISPARRGPAPSGPLTDKSAKSYTSARPLQHSAHSITRRSPSRVPLRRVRAIRGAAPVSTPSSA